MKPGSPQAMIQWAPEDLPRFRKAIEAAEGKPSFYFTPKNERAPLEFYPPYAKYLLEYLEGGMK